MLEHDDPGGDGAHRVMPAHPTVQHVRAHVAVWSWLALGVVVALLGTFFLVKVIGGTDSTATTLVPTSSQVLEEVTGVPVSVTNNVGVNSPTVPVDPPTVVSGAPPLTARAADGARVPEVLYLGTEFCSFCAAERWPLIVALSRFGHFNTLFDLESSLTDYAPGTPTFSFADTTYKSVYLVFRPFEVQSNVLGSDGYRPLTAVPAPVHAVLVRFDPTSTYPFVDVANRVVVLQANLSPETFVGLTRDQVAAGLSDPTSAVTQAIVAAANELTASICHADGQQPGTVCASVGVLRADAVLGLRG